MLTPIDLMLLLVNIFLSIMNNEVSILIIKTSSCNTYMCIVEVLVF